MVDGLRTTTFTPIDNERSTMNTELTLYNTLSRREEAVTPLQMDVDGHPMLRIYACGPTVYSFAHIGNFRSFLTTDLLLRTARALGWRTRYVSNITDVGHLTEDDLADARGQDKMARALEREGSRFANIYELARFYTSALEDDWRALNLLEPDVRPRATEHVTQQIEAVEKLVATGHAYETEDGVYFHVPSFPDYGRLSGNVEAEALAVGAAAESRQIVTDDAKRDPRDFALWKKDPGHLMQWYSPFGRGFPGWHIECSVMAEQYLGQTIDVHAGGEDLIFPHHECEIAQAESLSEAPFSRVWMHTRFLQVEGEKMSKSRGNFYTVRDLILPAEEGGRGVDPLALRYALISGHYRKTLNFTLAHLQTAVKLTARIRLAYERAAEAAQRHGDGPAGGHQLAVALEAAYDAAFEAMRDDLNTPRALAAVLEGVGRILDADLTPAGGRAAKAFLDRVNALLGIVRSEVDVHDHPIADPLAERVEGLIAERTAARQRKDFTRADVLRGEIEAMGVEVMDSPTGTTWRRRVEV
jgi:cysteinyl-tRNA synthetase